MKLVFDIGANVGNTVEFFRNISEKVVAFEANPKLINHLMKRFDNTNVIIEPRGVSNEIGRKIFKIAGVDTISTFSDDWIENSRFNSTNKWEEFVEVDTITLTESVVMYGIPDYIKIDVEGYEYEVLTAFDILLPKTTISFEWAEEQKDKLIKIIRHLNNLGYNQFSHTFGDSILLDGDIDWTEFDNFDMMDDLVPERKDKWGMIYVKK